jgi:hypothetical protein
VAKERIRAGLVIRIITKAIELTERFRASRSAQDVSRDVDRICGIAVLAG